MAGVGAPVIFAFQGSVFSRWVSVRELVSYHSAITTTKHRCWRTDDIGNSAVRADRIRDHLANLLFTRSVIATPLALRQRRLTIRH